MEGQAQAIAPLYGEREGMASGLTGPSHSYLRDETRVAKTLNQSLVHQMYSARLPAGELPRYG